MAGPFDCVLGLDGGGTKTVLAVADRNGDVRLAQAGPTLDPVAEPAWPDVLRAALAPAATLMPQVGSAILGLPYHGEIAALSRTQVEVARHVLPPVHGVINDVHAAFEGALAGCAGVLILAGTGSMAWAGDGARETRVGGWGDVFGDEGSAYWIGRVALAEASHGLDGRSTELDFAHDLLARIGIAPDDLIGWCYGQHRRRTAIAALARVVDVMAEAGDAVATAILIRAARHLAAHAIAGRTQLALRGDLRWSYAGGVFASPTVLRTVAEILGRPAVPPRLPPVGGALLRAARLGGWAPDDAWIDRLADGLATAGLALSPDHDGATRCSHDL